MSIHTLPVSPPTIRETGESDEALNELLRHAVIAFHAQGLRAVGSISGRHHLAIAHTYLHAIEVMLDKPGLKNELAQCLACRIFDVRRLARLARDFMMAPEAA